jgi:hypothetical protein
MIAWKPAFPSDSMVRYFQSEILRGMSPAKANMLVKANYGKGINPIYANKMARDLSSRRKASVASFNAYQGQRVRQSAAADSYIKSGKDFRYILRAKYKVFDININEYRTEHIQVGFHRLDRHTNMIHALKRKLMIRQMATDKLGQYDYQNIGGEQYEQLRLFDETGESPFDTFDPNDIEITGFFRTQN